MGATALIFIVVFFILIAIPCLGVGWLGYKLITRLGRYPSKTPAIQLGIMLKLIIVEVVSLTLILLLFKILVSE
ncbi:MAG: hypothetical protein H6754_07080 [Candidatus Omnitrophica bacterium]|nr:hypothetical protein [Candidatus Omnitrophota bacterium]